MTDIQTFKRDYESFLVDDMLQQFKSENTPNSNTLYKALAIELQEIANAFIEINTKTTLETATGINLDNIGDIVKLTRAQAAMLSSEIVNNLEDVPPDEIKKLPDSVKELLNAHASFGIIPFKVLDDERYRELLKFKIFLNCTNCNYYDVKKAFSMFWNKTPVYYSEDVVINGVNYPATIMLSTPELDPSQNARLFFIIPVIRAAGVAVIKKAETVYERKYKTIRSTGVGWNCISESELPPYDWTFNAHKDVGVFHFSDYYTESTLPEMEVKNQDG